MKCKTKSKVERTLYCIVTTFFQEEMAKPFLITAELGT